MKHQPGGVKWWCNNKHPQRAPPAQCFHSKGLRLTRTAVHQALHGIWSPWYKETKSTEGGATSYKTFPLESGTDMSIPLIFHWLKPVTWSPLAWGSGKCNSSMCLRDSSTSHVSGFVLNNVCLYMHVCLCVCVYIYLIDMCVYTNLCIFA